MGVDPKTCKISQTNLATKLIVGPVKINFLRIHRAFPAVMWERGTVGNRGIKTRNDLDRDSTTSLLPVHNSRACSDVSIPSKQKLLRIRVFRVIHEIMNTQVKPEL